MTQKDIRDIAAYVGCPYSVEICDQNTKKEGWPLEWYLIEEKGLGLFTVILYFDIENNGGNSHARDLKLHLRSMGSLTDEEEDYFTKHFGQKMVELVSYFYEKGGNLNLVTLAAPAIAYLRSIGVYVPGTIDEKYVTIIDK
jgi:hypothetical protein